MKPILYDELTSWYLLLDPTDEHAPECDCFHDAFERAVEGSAGGEARTLLELGSGAGNNVFHLKQHYRCTMSDVSAPMLALSRDLNPECEAVLGDMRELRLERTFDCVLVHDAVTYMTSVEQLRAAVHTAFVHTRPGGAAIFTPDDLADDFVERCSLVENDDGAGRSLRCLEWEWDPLPGDDMARTDMAFLLRDGDQVQAVSDCHISGLFARATWLDVLSRAGYTVEIAERPIGEGAVDEIFVCRRPR